MRLSKHVTCLAAAAIAAGGLSPAADSAQARQITKCHEPMQFRTFKANGRSARVGLAACVDRKETGNNGLDYTAFIRVAWSGDLIFRSFVVRPRLELSRRGRDPDIDGASGRCELAGFIGGPPGRRVCEAPVYHTFRDARQFFTGDGNVTYNIARGGKPPRTRTLTGSPRIP
jgi:hypothetical protein